LGSLIILRNNDKSSHKASSALMLLVMQEAGYLARENSVAGIPVVLI